MSHYKHANRAVNNALHHLKEAQECVSELKEIDKEACGTWSKELKEIEKQLSRCCRKIETKHRKNTEVIKTASYSNKILSGVKRKELTKISELIDLAKQVNDKDWENELKKEFEIIATNNDCMSCGSSNKCKSCEECQNCGCGC